MLCFATGLLMEWGIALAILLLLLGFFTILYWRKRKLKGAKGCHCFGHHSWLNRPTHPHRQTASRPVNFVDVRRWGVVSFSVKYPSAVIPT
ncbi:hypothetical protein [Paenibacillus dendritiformis]|uniref:hypothetical protein n=1 Tax=Paenibacillus dendritiformis TaxID=130049 RepID=UPI003B5B2C33